MDTNCSLGVNPSEAASNSDDTASKGRNCCRSILSNFDREAHTHSG
jgi:hypothetical protein